MELQPSAYAEMANPETWAGNGRDDVITDQRWEEEWKAGGPPGGTAPPLREGYECVQGVEDPRDGSQRCPSSTETHLDGLLAGRSRLRPVVRSTAPPPAPATSPYVIPSRDMLRDASERSSRSQALPDASPYSANNTQALYGRQMLRPVPAAGPAAPQHVSPDRRGEVPGQHILRASPAGGVSRPHDVSTPGGCFERPALRSTPGARASTVSGTRWVPSQSPAVPTSGALGGTFSDAVPPPDTRFTEGRSDGDPSGSQQYAHVTRGPAQGGPRASTVWARPSVADLGGPRGEFSSDVRQSLSPDFGASTDGFDDGSSSWQGSPMQREALGNGDTQLSRSEHGGGQGGHVAAVVQEHGYTNVAPPHGWDGSEASAQAHGLLSDHVAAARGVYGSDVAEMYAGPDAVHSGHVTVPHAWDGPQPRASIAPARPSTSPSLGPPLPVLHVTNRMAAPSGRPTLAGSPFVVDGSPASNPASPALWYPGGPMHSMGPWHIGAMHAPVSPAGTPWGTADAPWVDAADPWQSGASGPVLVTGPGGALHMMVPSPYAGMVPQKGPGSGHVAGLHQPHPDSPAGRLRSELMSKIGSQAASQAAGD